MTYRSIRFFPYTKHVVPDKQVTNSRCLVVIMARSAIRWCDGEAVAGITPPPAHTASLSTA